MSAVATVALVVAVASPSPSPCFSSLKFGGTVFLDTGQTVSRAQVGPSAGETDPNPAPCGLPDRVTVHRVTGHSTTADVAYLRLDGTYELYASAGQAGFPAQGLLQWAVVALAVIIIVFAAVPALTAHLRQPRELPEDDDP